MNLHCVITTIAGPTDSVRALHGELQKAGARMVVAGDAKGPEVYDLEAVDFLSLDEQRNGKFRLGRELPTGHYARKNMGYLRAIADGAGCIYETDDDNAPLPGWKPREELLTDVRLVVSQEEREGREGAERHVDCGPTTDQGPRTTDRPSWVNVYKFFTDENIWPRGLPLDEIHGPDVESSHIAGPVTAEWNVESDTAQTRVEQEEREERDQEPRTKDHGPRTTDHRPGTKDQLTRRAQRKASFRAPIQQGLVNGSPDVDAIWRLTMGRTFEFDQAESVYLAPGNWCPFNTQSTWWWPVAYPLLYVPSYCSFRMCDIWKSFVAQRCLWELNLGVAFHAPEVWQDRNPHDLMRDFEAEIPGYKRNREFARVLEDLDLKPGEHAIGENLMRCYRALVGAGFFPEKELDLVEIWLTDLERAFQ